MKTTWMAGACLVSVIALAGCARDTGTNDMTDDVAGNIEKSLDQANIGDVDVDQDRDKGVVRLTGSVSTDAEKAEAEAIAKAAAPRDVIANEIRVLPAGMESRADDVADDLDAGIERNLDAAFTKSAVRDVTPRVETQVVTLTGEVASAAERTRVEKIAAEVPNVKQVVNELEVKERTAPRATTR